MKTAAAVIIALLIPLAFAYGQEQDSLIIDSLHVELGSVYAGMTAWGVTYDSVCYYNISIRCITPLGGVHMQLPNWYFEPLNLWEVHFDTMIQDVINLVGFCELFDSTVYHQPIFTNGARARLFMMRVIIDPNTPPQVVTFDTVGQLSFGNNPVFRRGYLVIGHPTGIEDGGPTPQAFELSQNYPNPFNSQTTISYSLPQSGPVTLSIYNIMGQKVVMLLDEVQDAGEHRVVWDAKDVTSGIYFARLESNKTSNTIRMEILK